MLHLSNSAVAAARTTPNSLPISAPHPRTASPHNHNVCLRPDPLRISRARHSLRPPGPEGALRPAARPARCFLRLCWQVRWRRRCPRPPPRGVFRGVHCQVCCSCVAVFGREGEQVGGCNGAEERRRWRSDASEEEKAHTCSMAPLGICMSAWSRDLARKPREAVELRYDEP